MGKLPVTSFVFFGTLGQMTICSDSPVHVASTLGQNGVTSTTSGPGIRSTLCHTRLLPTLGEVKERKAPRYARKMLEQGSKEKLHNDLVHDWLLIVEVKVEPITPSCGERCLSRRSVSSEGQRVETEPKPSVHVTFSALFCVKNMERVTVT